MPAVTYKSSRTTSFIFIGSAIAGIAAIVVVIAQSIRQTPGWEGLLTGTVIGFLIGMMILLAGMKLAMKRVTIDPVPPQIDDKTAAALAPVLVAMETARLEIIRQVRARALWRVPLGIAAGVAFWASGEDEKGLFDLVMLAGFGGLIGEFWASWGLSETYRRRYKDKVLPKLAARFGALTYRAARHPDMGRLRDEKIFGDHDRVIAEDEFVGIYHGLAVSIVELTLEAGSGKSRRTVFNGLLAEVELPRRLRGDTAVLPDSGAFGNFRNWIAKGSRTCVRLEDPRFESAYQVWATDQIAARALLTPAFMERFLSLAELSSFGQPLALARDERLLLVLPSLGRNLFEPPSYRRPAAGRTALAELERDIAAVLAIADAVIDLDYAARAVADHAGRAAQHGAGTGLTSSSPEKIEEVTMEPRQ